MKFQLQKVVPGPEFETHRLVHFWEAVIIATVYILATDWPAHGHPCPFLKWGNTVTSASTCRENLKLGTCKDADELDSARNGKALANDDYVLRLVQVPFCLRELPASSGWRSTLRIPKRPFSTSGTLVHLNSYMNSWNMWIHIWKIIWIHSLYEFIYEFMYMNSYTYEFIWSLYEIIYSLHIWIHIHLNSYMQWIYEFMSIWIHVYEYKCMDSEFIYEFINIWIQI